VNSPRKSGKRGITATDLDLEPEPPAEARIEKDMVLMSFVKAVLTRDKKTSERFVCLNFSALLSPEAANLFCEAISTRYCMMLKDDGIPDLHISDCPLQMLDIADAEVGGNVLHEPVTPTKVALATIEQKGTGETVTGIRLSFTAPIKQRRDVLNWAAENHGELVWVKMTDIQAKLSAAKHS
jgi:hypothetical protein